jgi:hypothetical protein
MGGVGRKIFAVIGWRWERGGGEVRRIGRGGEGMGGSSAGGGEGVPWVGHALRCLWLKGGAEGLQAVAKSCCCSEGAAAAAGLCGGRLLIALSEQHSAASQPSTG